KFNTAIAAMMSFINDVYDAGTVTKDELGTFAKVLSPFAPHLAEEVWSVLGNTTLVSLEKWPEFDPAKTVDDTVEIALQVNGKLRGTMMSPKAATKEELLKQAYEQSRIAESVAGKTVVKEIVVPGKIVNIVVR
ncbi:MAG: class I tRNA ligase family protein, partial [Clostridia bacterium]|nr:class I tRNA ligase family protein [Clostridia bacterium]